MNRARTEYPDVVAKVLRLPRAAPGREVEVARQRFPAEGRLNAVQTIAFEPSIRGLARIAVILRREQSARELGPHAYGRIDGAQRVAGHVPVEIPDFRRARRTIDHDLVLDRSQGLNHDVPHAGLQRVAERPAAVGQPLSGDALRSRVDPVVRIEHTRPVRIDHAGACVDGKCHRHALRPARGGMDAQDVDLDHRVDLIGQTGVIRIVTGTGGTRPSIEGLQLQPDGVRVVEALPQGDLVQLHRGELILCLRARGVDGVGGRRYACARHGTDERGNRQADHHECHAQPGQVASSQGALEALADTHERAGRSAFGLALEEGIEFVGRLATPGHEPDSTEGIHAGRQCGRHAPIRSAGRLEREHDRDQRSQDPRRSSSSRCRRPAGAGFDV